MVEEENVAEEIQQEVVHPDPGQEPEPQAQEEPAESDKERNFRELREGKRQLEQEVRRLREDMERLSSPKEEAPAEPDLSDDDLVEGKHLKVALQRIEARLAAAQSAAVPDRLRSKFSDIDQVVTKENLEKLKHVEPELYSSILSGSDPYAKGVSAYKALKRFGIVEDDSYALEKEKVQKSHSRPMSTQAVKGQGALHEANVFANGLTPELRKKLYQEMTEAAKGHQ